MAQRTWAHLLACRCLCVQLFCYTHGVDHLGRGHLFSFCELLGVAWVEKMCQSKWKVTVSHRNGEFKCLCMQSVYEPPVECGTFSEHGTPIDPAPLWCNSALIILFSHVWGQQRSYIFLFLFLCCPCQVYLIGQFKVFRTKLRLDHITFTYWILSNSPCRREKVSRDRGSCGVNYKKVHPSTLCCLGYELQFHCWRGFVPLQW